MLLQLRQSVLMLVIMVLLTGVAYPTVLTGAFQLALPAKADSSLLVRNGKIVGSELVGQAFEGAEYFHSRPSFAGGGYDASLSGASNLGPTNAAYIQQVRSRVDEYVKLNGPGPVPVDAVTASGSGLDPHISPENARRQAPRVAAARNMTSEEVESLIARETEGRLLGFMGEPHVNVLKLNLALDSAAPAGQP